MNNNGIAAICVVLILGFAYIGHCIETEGAASRKLLMAMGTVIGDIESELSDMQKHVH